LYREQVHDAVEWSGFLGAWLLFAGPVYQAALELREQDAAHDVHATFAGFNQPPPVSPWWWLLPPVRYWLQRRREKRYRRAGMQTLPPEQLDALVEYINKATGWLFVALGGLLLAVKETWEACELHAWPTWLFLTLLVVAAGLCLFSTAALMERSRRIRGRASQPTPANSPNA
jgi:hypothetical protein